MKNYKVNDMKAGFFVGDFTPVAFNNSNVEVALKAIHKGTLDANYYRKIDTEVILVVEGAIEVNRKIYEEGDVIVFDPNEMINLFAVEDTKYILLKFPGTNNDRNVESWDCYEKLDDFFGYYLKRLIDITEPEADEHKEIQIDSKDISVIVQGAIEENTKYTLSSIRKYFPDSEIILSTWEGSNCDGLEYDSLIINKDPGGAPCGAWKDEPINNNGNRQIVSTKNGILKACRKYCLKLRSDLVILGDGLLKSFDINNYQDEKYRIFSHKILIGELFTRKNFVYYRNGREYSVPHPFHPSDWFMFGYTDDLKKMYESVDMIPKNELGGYVCKCAERMRDNEYKYTWRYTTEQHIFLGIVRKMFPNLKYDDWTDWSDEIIDLSDHIMKNNFLVLNLARHNVLNMKYIYPSFSNNYMRHDEKQIVTCKESIK